MCRYVIEKFFYFKKMLNLQNFVKGQVKSCLPFKETFWPKSMLWREIRRFYRFFKLFDNIFQMECIPLITSSLRPNLFPVNIVITSDETGLSISLFSYLTQIIESMLIIDSYTLPIIWWNPEWNNGAMFQIVSKCPW